MKRAELIKAIVAVLAAGGILTAGVSIYMSGAQIAAKEAQSVTAMDVPGDVIGTLAPGMQTGPGVDTGSEIIEDGVVVISSSRGTYDDFLRKLDALDASLSAVRKTSSDTSALARKNREEAELNAWMTQMNVIYDTICDKLDGVSRAALVRSQMERMDEISSSSEAARARAYELLEQYRDVL